MSLTRTALLSIALLAIPAQRVHAQFQASASVEHFHWSEDTQPEVEETGPRWTIGLAWTQPDSSPVRFGARATFYAGYVRYRGSLLFEPTTPASGTTHYLGTAQEAFLRIRVTRALDLVGGVGRESWRRSLSPDQREDYRVGFMRFGAEAFLGTERGLVLGGGLKAPFGESENAHLTLLGFDQNPRLEPHGRTSGFAQAGYRFAPRWSVVGYLDGFHFDASPPVAVTSGGGTPRIVFQPASDLRLLGLRVIRHF